MNWEKNMRIIGIDPGYAILGYGILDYEKSKFSVVKYGAITTDAKLDMPARLENIFTTLNTILKEYEPDEASIEELFFNSNQKTAIKVGEARGVSVLACALNHIRIFEYTPLQIKQSLVGNGRANKNQVEYMVKAILNLRETPKPDDTADAIAAAICHGNSRNGNMLLERIVKYK